jgi:iron complex outermembrane receptor protein
MVGRFLLGPLTCFGIVALLLSSPPAKSQENVVTVPQTTAAVEELPKITVTGYIVPRIGDGPQPVITLDQQFIRDQGSQTVSNLLLRLPLNSGGSFSQQVSAGNSFSPGAAAISLRGLGPQNTLVLVDGFRYPAFPFPQNLNISFVDLNSIPLEPVERIEILKDGGSATYGSDAIAGVVNLILKDEYQGADLLSYYGISQRGDLETYRAAATTGFTLKPTETSQFSLVAAFDFFNQSPILATNRGFSNVTSHAKFGSYFNLPADVNGTAGTFMGQTTGTIYYVPPGATTATLTITAPPFINPSNSTVYDTDLSGREQRFGAYLNTKYDFNQYVRLHEEFLFQRTTEVTVTPNQGFSGLDELVIPASNPFNPTGEALTPLAVIQGLDTREFGPWRSTTNVSTYRNVAGITLLNLPKNWLGDFSINYGESDGTLTIQNAINRTRMQEALNGTLPGFEGVYYNPFVDQSANLRPNPPALVDAIRTFQQVNSRTTLNQWTLKGGGELFDVPAGPITIGLGAEYRSESLAEINDPNSHDVTLINGLPVSNITAATYPGTLTTANQYLWSGFGELSIPILGGKWSWPGARRLELLLQERYDAYSQFGGASKPKFSIRYKPLDDLTFLATYAEGFRAPSLAELFTSQIQQLAPSLLFDPVTGSTIFPVVFVRGNPNLQPVNSYSYYLEAVWAPGSADPEHSWWGWANGFTAYIDWYEITRHNDIGQIDVQTVLSSNNPALVIRNPQTGQVEFLNDPFTNLGSTLTEGMDFGFSYVTKEFPWGKLEALLDANYLYNRSVKTLVPPGKFLVFDETDSFTFPDFKMQASLFYSKTVFGNDTFRTGFTLNYVDSEHDAADNFKGTDPFGSTEPNGLVHRVGSWTTVDWQASYTLGPPAEVIPESPKPGYDKEGKRIIGEQAISPKAEGPKSGLRRWLANTTVTFGINNIGDVKPPFADVPIGYDSETTTGIGRFFYFQLEKRF